MTGAQIEVVEPGLAVALQDRGRFGWRRLGVPISGALDPALLAIANALAGGLQETDSAAFEVLLQGPTLAVRAGRVRFALAGPIAAVVERADGGKHDVPAWSTATLSAGDVIRIGAIAAAPPPTPVDPAANQPEPLALAYIAVSGGVQVPPVLDSRSTYARAALGGVDGRALRAGDRLACGSVPDSDQMERRGTSAFGHVSGPIGVLPGPQDDHFTRAAFDTLFSTPYIAQRDSDRMGLRLVGVKLEHSSLGPDIASDGVTPGAIQVPADGQPIVLLADCQTVGGYPKIATVQRADLPRLAHVRPGGAVRFIGVDIQQAAAARQALAERIAGWCTAIESFQPEGGLDEAALYGCNLVSGVVRADLAD
ncbi:MAG: biotin-dependent carboxyltransferase family protein [Burkholderiales bacterium]